MWFISQLTVNFRPVWSEVMTGLRLLVTKGWSECIWTVLSARLQSTIQSFSLPSDHAQHPELSSPTASESQISQELFDLKSEFVDYHVTQLSDLLACCRYDSLPSSHATRSFDAVTFEGQLLLACQTIMSTVEKHSREFTPALLDFAAPLHKSIDETHLPPKNLKIIRTRLCNYLTLLTHAINPKAYYRADEVRLLLLNLLQIGEKSIQHLALESLIRFKVCAVTLPSHRG